ncbi:MAG: AAA family ATPase [Ruminococcus sp.]|nr:AAA family ATPase [Ruminococcus sp.]
MIYLNKILEMLEFIDPARLDYSEWLSVGMVLKQEGFDCSVWEDWSRKDPARYHSGECESKWKGFNGSLTPVTGGTLYQMALQFGYTPPVGSVDEAMSWNDEIARDRLRVIEGVEAQPLNIPESWSPREQLIDYLNALFDSEEYVGYVTESWQNSEGKYLPSKGCYDRTAGQLINELKNLGNDDIGAVFGDYKEEVGAWIRFNPLDGAGVKNENVTEFRFALVESDNIDIETQNTIIRELELPVAALVYSGAKSIHAIVRIEANDSKEYAERVKYLYKVCNKNGFNIDKQNKNPSRLSRMPGVIRAGKKQYLLATNIGKASWEEWYEYIEGINDDLPDIECFADIAYNLPELSPELICGVLRQGHKMLLSGPPKAGKSFALIELAGAIASGGEWLGFQCARGKVLYVNFEIDRSSFLHRVDDVCAAKGVDRSFFKNIDFWSLRGMSVPMNQLTPKLIRRAIKNKYIAVIIDPIYKVITGDENSAEEMAKFCNEFDKIAHDLHCAVIYCHHHSKGSQSWKSAMDRASGSGVFSRDPDALLDMLELSMDSVELSEDDEIGSGETAWRIEGTLREFPSFSPRNIFYKFPIHYVDDERKLDRAQPKGSIQGKGKASENYKEKKYQTDLDNLIVAFNNIKNPQLNAVTVKQLADYLKKSSRTIYRLEAFQENFEKLEEANGLYRLKESDNFQ